MGKQIIIYYSEEFIERTDELLLILYTKNYFAFKEDAQKYVDKIYDFIRNNISTYPAKKTPAALSAYGSKYIICKANARTTWYIFFDVNEEKYFVKFITNNHTELATNFNL